MGQTNLLQALGWAVLNSLWQLALLWVIYQFLTGITRVRASQKSLLATVLLMLGFGWFVYTFFSLVSLGNHSSSTSVISSGFVNVAGNEQLNEWMQTTLPIASLIYLGLLILPVLRFIRNYRYVQVIRKHGLSKVNVEWKIFVRELAARMGIRKPVQIWISELVSSPVTIGFIKPMILVPLAAINHLTPQQLEAVLLHELSHIRRFDYLVNLLINFIQTLLYFNPFVKAFVKIIEREREKSCDEMVIQFRYDTHEYASALLILEKNNHCPKPLAMAAAGKKNDLLTRVEWILGIRRKPVLSFNKLAGLFAGLLCIIGLNALVIMTRPLNGNKNASFTRLSSPFYFFTGDQEVPEQQPELSTGSVTVEKRITIDEKLKPVDHFTPQTEVVLAPSYPPGFQMVNYIPAEIAELKNYQKVQVKEAIEASRKVLESIHWKTVEKNIADVLTQLEKDQLRSQYQAELNKMDWKKWENKLRLAYNKVDWEKVNEQLSKAISNIKLDSLQYAYTKVAGNLDRVQKEMEENELKGIPDTDISLNQVQRQKNEAQKNLNNLKSLRSKKIIHL